MDIYALGATMYKMLTGHRPPIASDILNSGFPIDALRSLNVSEETSNLLQSLMKPQRKCRPQTDEAVKAELTKLFKPEDENTIYEEDDVSSKNVDTYTFDQCTAFLDEHEKTSPLWRVIHRRRKYLLGQLKADACFHFKSCKTRDDYLKFIDRFPISGASSFVPSNLQRAILYSTIDSLRPSLVQKIYCMFTLYKCDPGYRSCINKSVLCIVLLSIVIVAAFLL
jgi:serine/threonine protein kinase